VNVLQLLHLGQKTCMVILRCDGHEGLIAFRAGQISNATCGDVAGQAALEQLLGWRRPMIEVADDMFSPGRTIYAPFAQTLGEAAPRELVVEDDVAEELPAPAATIEEPIGIASPEACEQEEARRRPRADGEDELLSVLLLADSEQQLVARLAEIHDTGPIAALHTREDEGALERIEPSEAAPLVFETLYDRASAALSAGDVTSANAYISALLAQDPLRLGAHFLLARLYEQVGEHNQAIAAYRRTVFLEHGFVPGHLGMAVGFKALGRPADMQRCYRNALKLLSLMPPESPIAELGGAKVHELVANIARESV
jgi:tetratricopeptide (TPR) repeat protein